MPNFYSSKQIIKVLLKKKFSFVSQKGSHQKYKKTSFPNLTVIVPANKKIIPIGTFRSILKQANLTLEEFEQAINF